MLSTGAGRITNARFCRSWIFGTGNFAFREKAYGEKPDYHNFYFAEIVEEY